MSVGSIAALIAAGAFVLLVVLIAIPLLKLGRTLDETTLTIRQVREQSAPILGQASTTVAHVNSNLERVDDITGNAANVSSNVAALSSVVAATLGTPLIKVAAFSYGVRTAAKKKREGAALAEAAQRDKDARRGAARGAAGRLMRRLFWLAMGITIGALVVRKLSRAAEKMTPAGIAGSIAEGLRDLAEAIGDFGADIRAAAAEREAELRAGTGLDAPLPAGDQIQLPGRLGAHTADS